MKLLLMADNRVGLEVTRWLIEQYPEDLALVVSTAENDVLAMAKGAGLPCTTFSSADGIVRYFQEHSLTPDLGLLAWWPKIVKFPLLNIPRQGFINTHPSFLPHNRGKHYNFWAIVEEVPFGVSLHFVDEGIDTGDLIAQKEIAYNWEDTGGSLYHRAVECMVELVKETYPAIRTGAIRSRKQELTDGSFHLAKELDSASKLDLHQTYTVRALLNLLRARTFPGHPACWFEDNNAKFEVRVEIRKKMP